MRGFSISGRGKARPRRSRRGDSWNCPGEFLDIEERLGKRGIELIAGVDEAGRGPLAGPVVAAAVILRAGDIPQGIKDSKKVSAGRRAQLCEEITQRAVSVGIGLVSAATIDRFNILQATLWAMTEAVLWLDVRPDCVIADGNALPDLPMPVIGIVKGDMRCRSVAAASIVAKVTRDRIMESMDLLYPRYSFRYNKGYGTRGHLEALIKYGPTRVHRYSFEPILSIVGGGGA